jgi:hypothetical protein
MKKRTCGECYHWCQIGDTGDGHCHGVPPSVMIGGTIQHPITKQVAPHYVSAFPTVGRGCVECGAFKPLVAVMDFSALSPAGQA